MSYPVSLSLRIESKNSVLHSVQYSLINHSMNRFSYLYFFLSLSYLILCYLHFIFIQMVNLRFCSCLSSPNPNTVERNIRHTALHQSILPLTYCPNICASHDEIFIILNDDMYACNLCTYITGYIQFWADYLPSQENSITTW